MLNSTTMTTVFNAPVEFSLHTSSQYSSLQKILHGLRKFLLMTLAKDSPIGQPSTVSDKAVCGYVAYASLEAGDHRLYHSDP